ATPPPASSSAPFPARDELTLAWGDQVLGRLGQRARARFRAGRFSGVEGDIALFALPDLFHRDRCVEVQQEVEQALSAHFGRPIRLRLTIDGEAAPAAPQDAPAPAAPPPPDDDPVAWDDLTDAPPGAVASPLDHVMQAFQGAEVVED
ncbi:MAG: hypothetical protein ACRD12_12290, partial [Acidimicrobiales bacterium]